MEFRRATLDEQADPWLMERHEREIFPLLHRRAWFAEARDFLLYDLVTDDGAVDEHVFAYSNGTGPERSLVLFHDRFASTSGWIRDSAAYAVKSPDGSKRLMRRSLAEGLGLLDDPAAFIAFRDARTGLERLRSCREIRERGLHVRLDAYGGCVFWEFREIQDGATGKWARLADRLDGDGVPSLDEAMLELQLGPVHAPLRAIFGDGLVTRVLDGVAAADELAEFEERVVAFLGAIAEATGVLGGVRPLAAVIRSRTATTLSARVERQSRTDRAALLGWLLMARTGELAPSADVAATSRAWFDELRLAGAFVSGLRDAGLDEAEAWAGAELVQVLLALPRPSELRGPAPTADVRLFDQWLALDVVRTAIGVNTWQGVEYVDRSGFETMLRWADRLDAIEATTPLAGTTKIAGEAGNGSGATEDFVTRLSAAAEAAGYRVDRLQARLKPVSGRTPKPRSRGAAGRDAQH